MMRKAPSVPSCFVLAALLAAACGGGDGDQSGRSTRSDEGSGGSSSDDEQGQSGVPSKSPSWVIKYKLTDSKFSIRGTPAKLGDQVNTVVESPTTPVSGEKDDDIGPGYVVLRFEDDKGKPKFDGRVSLIEYSLEQHFQVSGTGEVETNLVVSMENLCGGANGEKTAATLSWDDNELAGVRSKGAITCHSAAAICDLGGLQVGENPRNVVEALPWNDFKFQGEEDLSSFTMAEVQVPAGLQEEVSDTFLSLVGTEVERELRAQEGFCGEIGDENSGSGGSTASGGNSGSGGNLGLGGGKTGEFDGEIGSPCCEAADCNSGTCSFRVMAAENSIKAGFSGRDVDSIACMQLDFPGGYCSNDAFNDACSDDSDCENAACFRPYAGMSDEEIEATKSSLSSLPLDLDAFGEMGLCLLPCESHADCRVSEGYVCTTPIGALFGAINPSFTQTYCMADQDFSHLVNPDAATGDVMACIDAGGPSAWDGGNAPTCTDPGGNSGSGGGDGSGGDTGSGGGDGSGGDDGSGGGSGQPVDPGTPADEPSWLITYDLVGSKFDIRATPFGAGNQTNTVVQNPTAPVSGQTDQDIGPGTITLRFEDDGGAPKLNGKVAVVSYELDMHFQVASLVTVETDLLASVDNVCGAATGNISAGSASWLNNTIYSVNSEGEIICTGGSCGLGGLSEGSNARNVTENLPWNAFVFTSASDISGFTMSEVQVPAGSQEGSSDTFLSLVGSETSRVMLSNEGFCAAGGGETGPVCVDLGGTTDANEPNESISEATAFSEVSACTGWENTKKTSTCAEIVDSSDEDWYSLPILDGHDGALNGSLYNDPEPRAELISSDGSTGFQLCVYWQRWDGDDSFGDACASGGDQSITLNGQKAWGCCASGTAPAVELHPDRDAWYAGGLTQAFNGTAWVQVKATQATAAAPYSLTLGDANSPQGGLCASKR